MRAFSRVGPLFGPQQAALVRRGAGGLGRSRSAGRRQGGSSGCVSRSWSAPCWHCGSLRLLPTGSPSQILRADARYGPVD